MSKVDWFWILGSTLMTNTITSTVKCTIPVCYTLLLLTSMGQNHRKTQCIIQDIVRWNSVPDQSQTVFKGFCSIIAQEWIIGLEDPEDWTMDRTAQHYRYCRFTCLPMTSATKIFAIGSVLSGHQLRIRRSRWKVLSIVLYPSGMGDSSGAAESNQSFHPWVRVMQQQMDEYTSITCYFYALLKTHNIRKYQNL